MVSSDEGRQIDRSDEQYQNADSPRTKSLDPVSNVKSERRPQLLKHDLEIVSIDEGIQIDRSERQLENADCGRTERFEPGSNETVTSWRQCRKQSVPIVSTDEGMQMDRSEVAQNAHSPKLNTRQPGSNVTDDIDEH
jgi:hypothetical protein